MKKIGVFVLLLVMAVSAAWGESADEKLGKALISAAEEQDFDKLRKALSDGANPNYINENEDFALMIVVKKDFLAGAKELLKGEYTCNVNQKNLYGQTALMIAAAECNDIAMIRLLMNAHAKTDEIDNQKKTVLMYATQNDNDEIFDYFFDDKGASLEKQDKNGNTVAMWACKNQNIHAFKKILNAPKGVSWNKVNEKGYNAFMYACENENYDFVNLMIDKTSFNKNTKTDSGLPIIMWMIDAHIDNEIIERVMDKYTPPKALLQLKDIKGQTVRDWAIMRDNDAVLDKLDKLEKKQQKLENSRR